MWAKLDGLYWNVATRTTTPHAQPAQKVKTYGAHPWQWYGKSPDTRDHTVLSATWYNVHTRSSAIAGRPCDAKACQGLLKWMWKWQPRLNDLQMYFKVIKSGTNRKLVYDFLLVVYSNFCSITRRFWEIWCETVQWPSNMPKVIDSRITWKLSCGHVCKMFGRQWTNEAKIAIFNDHTLIWRAPSPAKPANISLSLILPELRSLGYIFIADSIWVALQVFEQFCPKAGDANPLVAIPKQILTQNGNSRSFRVIYFGIIKEPLKGYIVQYNKYGLRCEGSECIDSERSENLHFRLPHSYLTPQFQRTPANIRIKLTLLETRIPGLHFCRW